MPSTNIRKVRGRRVWDSRGRPTVEAEVEVESGAIGRAIAPAGASTGSGEALDLRDDDAFDVRRAVANVNEIIARALTGADAADQQTVDGLLLAADGTPDKRRLGGNATIAPPWQRSTPRRQPTAFRSGDTCCRTRSPYLCPKSRFSEAAHMPHAVSISRT